jgi:hypothetical protein
MEYSFLGPGLAIGTHHKPIVALLSEAYQWRMPQPLHHGNYWPRSGLQN